MSGPEFNGPGGAVRHPATPRYSPYHWSTISPTVPGWYFGRGPTVSNSGWETFPVKVYAPAAGEELVGETISNGERVWAKLSDPRWKRWQWSFESLPEPIGG